MDVKHRKLWRVLLILAVCAGVVVIACTLYINDYYRAGDRALQILAVQDGDITISREKNWTAFDGPGEGVALAFYPGAKVEAAAYAPLMAEVARQGVDAFLLEPPLRLALLDIGAADRAMAIRPDARWFVGGHSMGGVAASFFAAMHPKSVAGVVLLASYPASGLSDEVRLLSICGDRDGVLNLANYEKSRPLWPKDSREHVIEGGNHAGFGDYGPQRGDGTADITPEEQQVQAAGLIAAFCLE